MDGERASQICCERFGLLPRPVQEPDLGRARILEGAGHGPRRRLFRWAYGVGQTASSVKRRKKPVRGLLSLRHSAADRLVLRQIRAFFGGRLRYLISGGAPLEAEVAFLICACWSIIGPRVRGEGRGGEGREGVRCLVNDGGCVVSVGV